MKKVLVIAEHLNGQIQDITYELLGKAKELAQGGEVAVLLMGKDMKDAASSLGAADKVLYVDSDALAQFNPQTYFLTAAKAIEEYQPDIVLIGTTSQGMDLAGALSARLKMPLVAYVGALEDGKAVSQLYGGKMNVEVGLSTPYIAAVLAGAFPADKGKADGTPEVVEMAAPDLSGAKVRFKQLIEPEAGDVDITAQDILVSVGRGIQSEDNIPMFEELAQKLGGALACSRPIVDNKWLPKSRQVGKSGLKVKPKVYLAFGISGAPEHIEGMKDSELIIAVNTDAKAPIFDYAHYGVTEDMFDLVPKLMEKL